MKKLGLFLIVLLMPLYGHAKDSDNVPKDFTIDYDFVQGGPASGATHEKYTLRGHTLTLATDYIPTQYGSDNSKRTSQSRTTELDSEKLTELWGIVQKSNFMQWSTSPAERPAAGGNQTFTITANGKKATHTMWDAGQKDQFIEFSTNFLQWAKVLMRPSL